MKKQAIYTVITGGYDQLRAPVVRTPGFDYICFTDDPELNCEGWQIRLLDKAADPCRQQREVKIRPHMFLPDYGLTVYIDGSHQLTGDLSSLIDEHFSGSWLLKVHPKRKCIYQEGQRCIETGKAHKDTVNAQLTEYLTAGMPAEYGLYETGIMIRDNTPEVNAVSDQWYAEVAKHSHRDQISLPFVLWKNGYRPQSLGARTFHRYFTIHRHAAATSSRIWYSTPYATDKNIGRAYNEFCAAVPDNDWICLRDGDTMFLHPQWGKQIADVVVGAGRDYALMGCTTNRLRSTRQLYQNNFSDDPNILNHRDIADELHATRYGQVRNAGHEIAGLFMLFPKSTWQKTPFPESTIYFDSLFSQAVLRAGGKIGIIEGLYCFHYYRFDQPNPTTYKAHLL
ncbi:glycosyltransferase domain-containing protein [Chitinophaga sp.]|uniref:glycosyltransferase domain-containing protein n=1 Tax=Chitinophaga sp. TaxID=1869181 RepID=UPI0031DDD78C